MVTIKTVPYVKSRVLNTKRLLNHALGNVNRYGQALLQYQQQQQQQAPQKRMHRPEYSQKGPSLMGKNAHTDAKAIEKINRLGAMITGILDGLMVLLKSKDDLAIYPRISAILYYLDFILDPFLSSTMVASLNTWSGVDIKRLTLDPLTVPIQAMMAPMKKKTGLSTFAFLAAQDAQTMFDERPQQGKKAIVWKGRPSLSSVLTLGLADLAKPSAKKRARIQT